MPGYFGSNKFKLGLFGLNCSGGCTLSAAPEAWQANWPEIVQGRADGRRGRY